MSGSRQRVRQSENLMSAYKVKLRLITSTFNVHFPHKWWIPRIYSQIKIHQWQRFNIRKALYLTCKIHVFYLFTE